MSPQVVVAGGGISGLSAADALVRGGAHVTLVEADTRLGGKLRTEPLGEEAVDVGAESLILRDPAVMEFCHELGLGDQLSTAQRSQISIWTSGKPRPLPAGVLSGLPNGLAPVLRSGILPPLTIARAALDLVLPARRPETGDQSVGELIERRLGRGVLDRLLDPLLGTIYAADSRRLSLRSTAPSLALLADQHRSLIRGLLAAGAQRATVPPPPFVTVRGGLERIAQALVRRIGLDSVRSGVRVTRLQQGAKAGADHRYGVLLDNGETLTADAVLIATPADQAGAILAEISPAATHELQGVNYVPVVVALIEYHAEHEPSATDSGLLVPSSERRLLGACTWLSGKWPHYANAARVVVRCSVARPRIAEALQLGDEEITAELARELRELGLMSFPTATRVTRWHQALPVYEPGHAERVTAIERAVARLDGVAVIGAAYHGIGVPQCISAGRAAAKRLLAEISSGS